MRVSRLCIMWSFFGRTSIRPPSSEFSSSCPAESTPEGLTFPKLDAVALGSNRPPDASSKIAPLELESKGAIPCGVAAMLLCRLDGSKVMPVPWVRR